MKHFLFLILVNFFLSVSFAESLPYADDGFKCTDQAEAQKMIKDFNINLKSFGGLELCNSATDFKKLTNDLTLIKEGRFTATGDNLFIRKFIDSSNYYSWLKSMTRGMNRGNDVPFATAYNRGGYFTMQDGWTKLSSLGRVGTIIHEARHTSFYRHTPCTHGPYMNASSDACDKDYKYGGSHAVEMEYYARVSVQGENFHPVYKSMARLMAIARSNFVFNDSPIKTREALFTISENGQGLLYNGDQVVHREVPSIEGALKRTSYGAAIYSKDKAYSIEMYENPNSKVNILDTYSYFKLLLSYNSKYTDFEEFDVNQKRHAVAVTEKNTWLAYDFPAGQWGRETSLNFQPVRSASTVETGKQGYYLIDRDNSIYELDMGQKTFSKPLSYKWNPEFVNIAKVDNRLFILKDDGKIYEKSRDGQIVASPLHQGNYRNIVAVPLYDGFEVQQ